LQEKIMIEIDEAQRLHDNQARPTSLRILALALGAILLPLAVISAASAADISVRQGWSRATPKGGQVAAGYLTIENHGSLPDRLLSVESSISRKTEIHEMITQDGIMMMREVEGGLPVPADTTLVLAPGGTHLMFVGLKEPLRENQQVPATLTFEKAGRIEFTFDVGSVGAKGPRLLMATTAAAPPAAVAPAPGAGGENFFTHLCGTEVMANVTVTPGRSGPVEVIVELEDIKEKPLTARALAVTLSNPERQIAPVTVQAERIADDRWRVRMLAAEPGKWLLALGIEVTEGKKVDIAAPILIE
jgi:copper(I)-binding protein